MASEHSPSAAAAGCSSASSAPSAPAAWNAGYYHWVDKPQTSFARERLAAALRALRFVLPGGHARIVEATVSGEATATVRKGRKATYFDLTARAAWEGTLIDADGNVRGTGDGELALDDLDQDTADDGSYALRWTAADDGGKPDAALRTALQASAAPAVRAAVAAFVAELRERG